MSSPKQSETSELLADAIAKKAAQFKAELSAGAIPTAAEVEEFERLQRLQEALAPNNDARRRRMEIALLLVVAVVLIGFAFTRIPSTAVDLEVRTTKMRVTLAGERKATLIPGEMGEILALRQARVTGADEVQPEGMGAGGRLELRLLTPPKETAGRMPEEFAVRLQEIAIPPSATETITVGVAYDADARGLVFEAAGAETSTARFGEVIPVGANGAVQYAIRPVRATGKDLVLELFPANAERQLTVFRDVHVSEVSFEDGGHSTILGGLALVKSGSEEGVRLQPSDGLTIRSASPMLVRELFLSKGELKATISAPQATAIRIGEGSGRNLMPTLFEWLRRRWPDQLYATLSAVVALGFAVRHWWNRLE